MDFENTFAKCIRTGDVCGLHALRLDKSLVNSVLICQTPVEQISGKFCLPEISSPTPLVYAILCGQKEIVEELLILGADLDNFVCDWKPIHYAIASRNTEITETIINFDPKQMETPTKTNNFPIHIATSSNDINLIVLLLKYGCSPNAQNKQKNTPLHIAALSHNFNIIRALLAFGGDINAKNQYDLTPLDIAIRCNRKNVADFIQSIINKETKIPSKEEIVAECETAFDGNKEVSKEEADIRAQKLAFSKEVAGFK